MNFDKPKVTIDLEEYQYLKDRVVGMDSDAYVIAAKKVVAAVLNSKSNLSTVYEYLSREGIMFSIVNHASASAFQHGIHYNQISISLIDKTK